MSWTQREPNLWTHLFGDENVFREDVVTNGDRREEMLANAPKMKEGQYQVPKTIG